MSAKTPLSLREKNILKRVVTQHFVHPLKKPEIHQFFCDLLASEYFSHRIACLALNKQVTPMEDYLPKVLPRIKEQYAVL